MRHLKPEEAYKILVRYHEEGPLRSLLEEFNISTGWPKIVALLGVPGDCDRKL